MESDSSGRRNEENGQDSPGDGYESLEKCTSSHSKDDTESVGSSWSHDEKKRAAHSDEAQRHLRRWMQSHLQYPYPTKTEKDKLAKETGLQFIQVAYWFTNARRRLLPGMLKEENTQRRDHGLPPITRQTDQWARPLTENPPHAQMALNGTDSNHQDAYISLPSDNQTGADLNGQNPETALTSPVQLSNVNHVLWQSEAQGLRNAMYLPITPPLKRQNGDHNTGHANKRVKDEMEDERPIARYTTGYHAAHNHANGRRSSSSSADATSHRYDGMQAAQSSASENSSTASFIHIAQPVYYAQPSTVYTQSTCMAHAVQADRHNVQYVVAGQTQNPAMQPQSVVQGHTILLHTPGSAPSAYTGVNGHHQLVQSPTQVTLPNGIPSHNHNHLIGLPNGIPSHNHSHLIGLPGGVPGHNPHSHLIGLPNGVNGHGHSKVILPTVPQHTQATVSAPQAYINQPVFLLARPEARQ